MTVDKRRKEVRQSAHKVQDTIITTKIIISIIHFNYENSEVQPKLTDERDGSAWHGFVSQIEH